MSLSFAPHLPNYRSLSTGIIPTIVGVGLTMQAGNAIQNFATTITGGVPKKEETNNRRAATARNTYAPG